METSRSVGDDLPTPMRQVNEKGQLNMEDLEAEGHDHGYGQTLEDLQERSKEIERTARSLRRAESFGDLISQITFERRLLQLIGVPDPGVF